MYQMLVNLVISAFHTQKPHGAFHTNYCRIFCFSKSSSPFLFIFSKATAVYQAKEKLKSIDKARKGERQHLSIALWMLLRSLTVFFVPDVCWLVVLQEASHQRKSSSTLTGSVPVTLCARHSTGFQVGTTEPRPSAPVVVFHFAANTLLGYRGSTQTLSHRPGDA